MEHEDPFQLDYEDLFDSPMDMLKAIRREPQMPYPLHTHEFSELVIVTRGRGFHYFEGEEEYPVVTGDVFTLQGRRAHGYCNIDGLYLVNIMFNPVLLENRLQDLNTLPGYHALFHLEPAYRKQHNFSSRLHLSPDSLNRAMGLAEKLEKEQQEKRGGYRFAETACFMELIAYLCRSYSEVPRGETRDLLAIGRVLAYLEENEDCHVGLEKMCEIAGMTPSTLTRHFNRALATPPVEYHIRLRIKRSCELLRSSPLSVTEIAYRTGFDDSNYFSRQFRKIMGFSPREYRRRL